MHTLFYVAIILALFGAVVWFFKFEATSRLEAWVFSVSKLCFALAIATLIFVQLIECSPDLEMRAPGFAAPATM